VLAEPYRKIAEQLIERHGLEADADEILFLADIAGTRPRPSGSTSLRIPEMWQDVLFQLTHHTFLYAIKFFQSNLDRLSTPQAAALLFHELKHIKRDMKTGKTFYEPHHDLEDWSELAPYGDWERPGAVLPNLMTESPTRLQLLPKEEGEAV
jgi:predicted metallopeptidase